MARHYVLGCWANADEYDYSGEQLMGHRKGKSICMDHMLPSGMANLSRYGDPVEKLEHKKKKSIADSIDLAERHYQRMEKMSEQLDNEYFAEELEEERYQLLRYKMDERLAKAWKRLEKDNSPIWQKMDEEHIENSYHQEQCNTNIQSKKTLTEGDHFINLVFNGLPDDNVFKAGFLFIQKLMRMFK